LENLTTCEAILIALNTKLNTLEGLGIVSIEDYLFIANPNLIDLSGLESLSYVGNRLAIRQNPSLTSLTGLNFPDTLNELEIVMNHALTDLTGLENLTTITGFLQIERNDALDNLSGLDNLTTAEKLTIYENYALRDISALNNLTTVEEDLWIGGNYELSNLSGLENLSYVGSDLIIDTNIALTNIIALNNVNYTSINYLKIQSNPFLTTCQALAICNYIESGRSHTIQANGTGCNNSSEIMQSCFLPVELISLKAHIEGKNAMIYWQTETETNNAGFEIQKSKDGIEWEHIGWQAGQGSTQTPHVYKYIDGNPFSNISYYRLKQVDFDGNFIYSNIVSLEYNRPHVNIYPNPVKDKLYINSDEQTIDNVLIFDTMGRQINTQVIDNTIDVSLLPKGIYTIKVIIGGQYFYEKIVVE